MVRLRGSSEPDAHGFRHGMVPASSLSILVTGFPVLLLSLVDGILAKTDLAWLLKVIPWGWKYELLSGDIGTRLLAYGVMVGFTIVFLYMGVRHFQKRDL